MHPVAKTVMCMPRRKQQSARLRVPTTLERIVASLLSSHQSTLGRPVQPAQLRTCVGRTSSSWASTASRFSMRTVVEYTSLPWASSSLLRWLATQPSPPQIRKRLAGAQEVPLEVQLEVLLSTPLALSLVITTNGSFELPFTMTG